MLKTDLIPYSTASQLAETFHRNTTRLRELITEVGELRQGLCEQFFGSHSFEVSLRSHQMDFAASEAGADMLIDMMAREAWRAIIEKLGIRQPMSAKKQDEMDEQLGLHRSRAKSDRPTPPLPPITPESIVSVLQGFISSADDFLDDAIREEYDFWKPSRQHETYKTNVKQSQGSLLLGRKVIKTGSVEVNYGTGWRFNHYVQPHARALDNLFHMLDGRGPAPGYESPLITALKTCTDGRGTTDYFAFRCCANGNIHLEFTRDDLLTEFNRRAGRGRLGSGCGEGR